MKKILFIILVGMFCLNATNGYAQKPQIKQFHTVRMSEVLTPDRVSDLNRKVIQAINRASFTNDKVYNACQRIEGFHSDKICLSWAMRMKKEDHRFQVTAVEQAQRNPYGLSTGKLLIVSYIFKGKTLQQIFAQAYGGWYMIKGTSELNTLPPPTNSDCQQKRPLIWT